jgi:hypothetical protein
VRNHPTPCELGGRRRHPIVMEVRPNDRDGATVDQPPDREGETSIGHDILPRTLSCDQLLSRQRVWRGQSHAPVLPGPCELPPWMRTARYRPPQLPSDATRDRHIVSSHYSSVTESAFAKSAGPRPKQVTPGKNGTSHILPFNSAAVRIQPVRPAESRSSELSYQRQQTPE